MSDINVTRLSGIVFGFVPQVGDEVNPMLGKSKKAYQWLRQVMVLYELISVHGKTY